MRQIKWFDSRYYEVITENGKEFYPSVTSILNVTPKPYLANWRGEVGNEEANEVLSEAKDKGSYVHSLIDHLNNGGLIIYNDELRPAYSESDIDNLRKYRSLKVVTNQFLYLQVYRYSQLFEQLSPASIMSERNVFSNTHKYAGTLDLVIYLEAREYNINGKPLRLEEGWYIGDIKTGKTISEDAYMQIAAYAEALNEDRMFEGEGIKGGFIIHTNALTKKGIPGLNLHIRTQRDLYDDFNRFLKVYEVFRMYPQSSPKDFTLPAALQINIKNKTIKDLIQSQTINEEV